MEDGSCIKNQKQKEVSLKFRGFGLLFAWHMVLIFSPLITDQVDPFFGYIWERQLVLCCSLGLSFFLFALIGESFYTAVAACQRNGIIGFGFIAILGCVSTCGALWPVNVSFLLVSTAIAGASEGILMMFWLVNYSSVNGVASNKFAALQAIIGTLACFFLCNLNYDLAVLTTAAIPLVSAFLFVQAVKINQTYALAPTSPENPIGPLPETGDALVERERSNKYYWSALAITGVFGLMFGFLQSVYVELDGILIGATDSAAILGATAAYSFIYLLLKRRYNPTTLFIILSLAFVAFSIGAVGVSFSSDASARICFGFWFMMGFHLFDFGVLAITIGLVGGFRLNSIHRIGINRMVVYLSYGLSFLLGHYFVAEFGEVDNISPIITSVSIVVLMATLVFFFLFRFLGVGAVDPYLLGTKGEVDSLIEDDRQDESINSQQIQNQQLKGGFKKTCTKIAEYYHLTSRETEVFLYLAKGRNAVYIGQQLWISSYTVKSHIANIYKKLEVHSSQDLFSVIDEFE